MRSAAAAIINIIIMLKKVVIAILLVNILVVSGVYAANLKDAFDLPLITAAGDSGAGYSMNASAEAMVGRVIQAVLSFLGLIFFMLMIYSGYLWMMAAGSEEQVTKAKNLIKAAVVGLIIVLSSYAISYFVLQEIGSETLINVGEDSGATSGRK